jgi:5-methylcytosine-specific restriction endonuclease McrA
MRTSEQKLNAVYDRTSGYCHICGKKLSFRNYGLHGKRGAWEIEHSSARINGGTDRLCNLYPACIGCNRRKQHFTTRTARRWSGRSRAPLSVSRRKQVKTENAIAGAGLGLLLGVPFGGAGAIAASLIGGLLGHHQNPDRR